MTNEVFTPSVTRMKHEGTQRRRKITGLCNKLDELLNAPIPVDAAFYAFFRTSNKIWHDVKKRLTSSRRRSTTKMPMVSFNLRHYTDRVIALEERIEDYMELWRGETSSFGSFHPPVQKKASRIQSFVPTIVKRASATDQRNQQN